MPSRRQGSSYTRSRRRAAPGPLIRVLEGTEIRTTVRNTLLRDTVVIRGLSTRGVTGSVDALRNRPLDGTPIPAEHHQPVTNHSTDMMGGLVMGITVRGLDTSTQSRAIPQRR